MNNQSGYSEPRCRYKAISAFKEVKDPDQWLECPNCGLKPLVWEFDNGRSTACGCGESQYIHPAIFAESIMSVLRRSHNGQSAAEYDSDELRKNWNHWVNTGEELFPYAGKRNDNRW